MSIITSTNLRRALHIQEQIENLQGELRELIGVAPASRAAATVTPSYSPATPTNGRRKKGRRKGAAAFKAPGSASIKAPAKPGRRSHPLKGRRRPESPTGPLAPAVIAVIKKAGKPMKVGDIFEGLQKSGYQWTCSEPKKNLYARIYRLRGVKRVREGVFGLA